MQDRVDGAKTSRFPTAIPFHPLEGAHLDAQKPLHVRDPSITHHSAEIACRVAGVDRQRVYPRCLFADRLMPIRATAG